MRVVVLGAGAIGAYVGARLATGGAEVSLVARGAQLAALQAGGVVVEEGDKTDAVALPATGDLDAICEAEVLFVSLKAYSLPELAPAIGARLAPGCATIWAQNGIPWWYFQGLEDPGGGPLESVDPGGAIRRAIDPASVLGCVVYCSTELVAPGVVRHVEGDRFSLGEPSGGRGARTEAISAAFSAGGLRAPVDANLRDQIWLKLLGNATFNPMTALTGATLGGLGRSEDTVALLAVLFAEVASVAEALGVRFPVSLERRLRAGLAVGEHRTSMLQDATARKPLEIDCTTGAVLELAGRLGLSLPHLETLHALVKQLDRSLAEGAHAPGPNPA